MYYTLHCLKKLKMASPNPKCCMETRTCRSIAEIVSKYKKLCDQTSQVLARSTCRDCGRLIGRCNFDLLKSQKRFNFIRSKELCIGIFFGGIFLLSGLTLLLIRRYNHTFIYGSGGCKSGVLWTYNDCVVMA
ncbi:uncharacterized protein LOC111604329 [Drosophila hydei]|uniref:Uncharacterized protein LOC111604329 n=1 Tax=Drosophila hydei TaxID=7224 RepID=A0A6J1MC01_DROHY|nr:uncharacterized protein LOC111604329 [Drosophila hydei]